MHAALIRTSGKAAERRALSLSPVSEVAMRVSAQGEGNTEDAEDAMVIAVCVWYQWCGVNREFGVV